MPDETQLGIRVTGTNFVYKLLLCLLFLFQSIEIAEYLFSVPSLTCFLSAFLSQDSFKKFFWLPTTMGEKWKYL